MRKKSLFLLASVVITAGLMSVNPAISKPVNNSNGAILYQMTTDNTGELKRIYEEFPFGECDMVERTRQLVNYYAQQNNYEKIRNEIIVNTLWGYVNELENQEEKENIANGIISIIEELKAENPHNIQYYILLADCYVFLQQYDKKNEIMFEAYKIDKKNKYVLFEIARFYFYNNDFYKCAKILESLKREFPRELEYRLALAKTYTQMGKYDDAVREYRVAAAFEPDNNETIVALNEVAQYSKIAHYSGGQFYDPMTAVKPVASPKGDKLVSLTTSVTQGKNEVDEEAIRARTKSTKAPSSKRVLVSYVNGRKVVKIVNVNTGSNTEETLTNAPATFSTQLEDSNKGYDIKSQTEQTEPINNTEKYELKPSSSSTTNTQPAVDRKPQTTTQTNNLQGYSTESKYQLNEKDYITNKTTSSDSSAPIFETTEYGDPSVKALSYNNTGRRQLLITYENGKKVVKMSNSDGTPISAVKSQNDTKKQQAKSKKSETKTISNAATKDNTDFYIKANEYILQQQYQAAIDVLKNVQPPTLRSLTAMASCYNSMGNTDTAIDYYKAADELSPNNTQILYSIAYLYYTKNDIPSAKRYLEESLKADSNNQNALQLKQYMGQQSSNEVMNQAVSYLNEGKYSEAKKILNKILFDNPNDFQAYYYLGHINYATQKYEESARNFANAIKYNPEYALSYYSIGLAFDKLKDFTKSLAAYQQFLQMETDDNKYTQYAKTRINTIRSKQ